jgi:hypothetical protein
MNDLLSFKFKNPQLKEELLNTHDYELIEGNYWNDIFCVICNGNVLNILEKLETI